MARTQQANHNKKRSTKRLRAISIILAMNGLIAFMYGNLVISFDTFAGGSYSPEDQALGNGLCIASLILLIVSFFMFVSTVND